MIKGTKAAIAKDYIAAQAVGCKDDTDFVYFDEIPALSLLVEYIQKFVRADGCLFPKREDECQKEITALKHDMDAEVGFNVSFCYATGRYTISFRDDGGLLVFIPHEQELSTRPKVI